MCVVVKRRCNAWLGWVGYAFVAMRESQPPQPSHLQQQKSKQRKSHKAFFHSEAEMFVSDFDLFPFRPPNGVACGNADLDLVFLHSAAAPPLSLRT